MFQDILIHTRPALPAGPSDDAEGVVPAGVDWLNPDEPLDGEGDGRYELQGGWHAAAFESWYGFGCDSTMAARAHSVSRPTIEKWRQAENWDALAIERRRLTEQDLRRRSVKRHLEVIKRTDEAADRLIELGLGYLEDEGISSAKDAIVAITKGLEFRLRTAPVPGELLEVVNASTEALTERAHQLLLELTRTGVAGDPEGAGAPGQGAPALGSGPGSGEDDDE